MPNFDVIFQSSTTTSTSNLTIPKPPIWPAISTICICFSTPTNGTNTSRQIHFLMQNIMLSVHHCPQVFRPVVSLNHVDMIHIGPGEQAGIMFSFPNISMFHHRTLTIRKMVIAFLYSPVSLRGHKSSTFPISIDRTETSLFINACRIFFVLSHIKNKPGQVFISFLCCWRSH